MIKLNYNKGYTLIELLVVAGILVSISGLVAGILITSLRGGAKSRITNEVSQNGNYALSNMTTEIVKSSNVVSVDGALGCMNTVVSPPTENRGQSVVLKQDDTTSTVSLVCDGTGIVKRVLLPDGTIDSEIQLTDKSQVSVNSCEFVCRQQDGDVFASPIVSVSFTLTQQATGVGVENLAETNFETSAALRNFRAF